MMLRIGARKVIRLGTTRLWDQGAIQSCGAGVKQVPRAENALNIARHPVGE